MDVAHWVAVGLGIVFLIFCVVGGLASFFGPVTWQDGEGPMPEGRNRRTSWISFRFWS